jgi:thymidylate synthase (FAD)
MHIVEPYAKVKFFMGLPYSMKDSSIEEWKPYANDALRVIEDVGRTCYRMEEKQTPESFDRFLRSHVMRDRHIKMMRFSQVIVEFVTDRGVSHEAYTHGATHVGLMESQRYCNYAAERFGRSIGFIKPKEFLSPQTDQDRQGEQIWTISMEQAEAAYLRMTDLKIKAQTAADVLPRATATKFNFTSNLQGWRHMLLTRSTDAVHPKFLDLTVGDTFHGVEAFDSLLGQFKTLWPFFFEDIEPLGSHIGNMQKVR